MKFELNNNMKKGRKLKKWKWARKGKGERDGRRGTPPGGGKTGSMSYPHHPNKNPEVTKGEETGKRLDGRNSGGFKEWPLVQWQGGDYNHPPRSAPVFSELHKSILNRPFCAELHIKKP